MPLMRSWVASANSAETAFPLNNLPYGVFATGDEAPRCGLDTGDEVVPELGWTTWMFSRPLDRDPDDAQLALWRL